MSTKGADKLQINSPPPQRRAHRPCANVEPRCHLAFASLLVVVEAGQPAAEDGRARARPSSNRDRPHPRHWVFIGPFNGDEARISLPLGVPISPLPLLLCKTLDPNPILKLIGYFYSDLI